MRVINEHRINPLNDRLMITVVDEPSDGGPCHKYEVMLPDVRAPDGSTSHRIWNIDFQNGPIAEAGLNGLTQEVLLAIVIDRLRSFQAGPYACRENALALTKIEEAQHWLLHRTRSRMSRGVEGTHQV